jgi:hypothetical protein
MHFARHSLQTVGEWRHATEIYWGGLILPPKSSVHITQLPEGDLDELGLEMLQYWEDVVEYVNGCISLQRSLSR